MPRYELTTLRTPHWRLINPIPLSTCREDDGQVLVWDSIVDEYGIGATLADALADYETSLIEYYGLIAEFPDDVHGCYLLAELRKYIQPHD